MKILIDTNMFLVPEKNKVDIFSELGRLGYTEFYTLTKVIEELKSLAKKPGKTGKEAKVGLLILKKSNVGVVESEGHADTTFLGLKGFAVCTQDRRLVREVSKQGRPVVILRNKKYLQEFSDTRR